MVHPGDGSHTRRASLRGRAVPVHSPPLRAHSPGSCYPTAALPPPAAGACLAPLPGTLGLGLCLVPRPAAASQTSGAQAARCNFSPSWCLAAAVLSAPSPALICSLCAERAGPSPGCTLPPAQAALCAYSALSSPTPTPFPFSPASSVIHPRGRAAGQRPLQSAVGQRTPAPTLWSPPHRPPVRPQSLQQPSPEGGGRNQPSPAAAEL